jgi:metal-dependent amidase/aminoacylase/carboxypeptidase family protein
MAKTMLTEEQVQELVALRRELHRHPEIGFQEFETRERMRAALLRAGLEAEAIKVYNPPPQQNSPVVLDSCTRSVSHHLQGVRTKISHMAVPDLLRSIAGVRADGPGGGHTRHGRG